MFSLSFLRRDRKSTALKTVVLTNTRQSGRFTAYTPDGGPDPNLEYSYLRDCGIDQSLRDRGLFPLNPFARSHVLFAGIDPLRALRVLLFDRNVDAVLCVFESTALVILALRRWFRFRPPVLLLEVSPRGWRTRDRILDFVMPRVDHVLTLTEHSKQYAERCFQLKRPAAVIGYAVDEKFFRLATPVPSERPESYVLAVGDDVSRDYETLLEACSTLSVRVVIRTGMTVAVPAKLSDKVEVITSRLSYRELRSLYCQARLVVIPLHATDNPGGITTLFEAMAMAKPIVCSDTGTTREIVLNGETGILVPCERVDALRDAISHLLASPDEAVNLGLAARARLEKAYSMRHRSHCIAAAIKQLCENSHYRDFE